MDLKSEKSIGDSKQKEAERSYGCPCGKTYLSHPALFTHVKQKHEGKVKKILVIGSRKACEAKIRQDTGKAKNKNKCNLLFMKPEDV